MILFAMVSFLYMRFVRVYEPFRCALRRPVSDFHPQLPFCANFRLQRLSKKENSKLTKGECMTVSEGALM